MKRTTIFIDESLERSLGELARRRARPVASLVREALTEYIAKASKAGVRPAFIAAGESGHTDTAEGHEELLWRSEGDTDGAVPKTKPSSRPRRK